jgi:hypothetical protein
VGNASEYGEFGSAWIGRENSLHQGQDSARPVADHDAFREAAMVEARGRRDRERADPRERCERCVVAAAARGRDEYNEREARKQ